MKTAHLTTVDMSLRYLVLPQLEAALEFGESIGISAPGEYVAELEGRGIRHIPLTASTREMSLGADIRSAWQLVRILRRESIDILHTHNPKPGLYGRVVGRLCGVPIVVNTVHGLYATEDSPLLKRVLVYTAEFIASRFSDAELVQSPEDFDLMTRLHISARGKTRLLGNGVDLTRFDRETIDEHRRAARHELGVDDDSVLVGMVGRLVEEKGVLELIEAAQDLDNRYVVVIIGPHDAEKDDAVSSEAIRRGEEAGVRFLGMRTDVERWYAAFDIFVLPSHREGFPRAAMEAAACGLPVIASDIRGCRQVVDDGVNGYLFPVRDVAALVDRIRRIGDDSKLAASMAEASATKARREFDEKAVVEKVMSTYRSVARTKGLDWGLQTSVSDPVIEVATRRDVAAVARLHQQLIATGFLSTLGPRFLMVLYRALLEDASSALFVARDQEHVVGFIAGTSDTGLFYKRFIRRHFGGAALALFPLLFRPSVWRPLFESLRYGGGVDSTPAELLSMGVAPVARKRGLGSGLVDRLLEWAKTSGLPEMRVVVGADNDAAIGLYERAGFGERTEMAVHADRPSWELTWSG